MNKKNIKVKSIPERMDDKIVEMKKKTGNKEIQADLCFCKKYRSRNQTNYTFYRANTNKDVSTELGSFLLRNIQELKSKQEVDESEDNIDDNYVRIDDLNEITNWKIFQDKAFSNTTQKLEDLKDLKRSLNCFLIYYKVDGMVIGQIRRLTSSKVLTNEGKLMRLAFGDKVFNKISDDDDITIDKYHDVMFYFDEKEKFGVINNYDAYYSIFDLNDQFFKEAKEVVSSSIIFDQFSDKGRIFDLIDNDRTLQRTLRNKVCSSAFKEVTKENIKEIKEKLGDSVCFEVKDNFEVILPEKTEKQALKEFIRGIGHYYNQSIYGEHIVEGRPIRYVNQDT